MKKITRYKMQCDLASQPQIISIVNDKNGERIFAKQNLLDFVELHSEREAVELFAKWLRIEFGMRHTSSFYCE